MSEPAFTAGVRPGGLTDETQIRILVCYTVQNFAPVTLPDMQQALCEDQLVNCFELADAVATLCRLGHLREESDGLHISSSGVMVANDLATAVPRSVRERALDAMLRLRAQQARQAQHKAEILPRKDECLLRCKLDDMGHTLLDITLAFPDLELAEHARDRFVQNGDAVYQLLVAGLTHDRTLADAFFTEQSKN